MTVYNRGQVRQQEQAFDEREEQVERNVHAFWSNHKYYRLNVVDFIKKFCGWSAIVELVRYASTELEKAFLAALFLSGGRIMEVLNLRKENFSVCTREEDGEKFLNVEDMPLEKRYKKIGAKFVGSDGKNHFETEKVFAVRNAFSIMLKEPLADILLNWINKSQGGLLFPSPYHHKGEKKGAKSLTRHWAYKFVLFLDKLIPASLKEALNLNKPFMVNKTEENPEGELKAKTLHLWLHWFRSQRVSQLFRDYHFNVPELMEYFSWTKYETAVRYLHLSPEQFAGKMNVATYK